MIDTRNDINHSGWRKDPFSPQTIEKNLEKFLEEAKQLILQKVPSINKGFD